MFHLDVAKVDRVQVFQMFHLDVAKVDRNIAHVAVAMFQVYVPNVSSRFSIHVFASVSSRCCMCFQTYELFSAVFCKCFIHMFRMFQLFVRMLQVFHLDLFKSRSGVTASDSDACFMCFICLQSYVASVVSGCFKSRLGIASLSLLFYRLTFASVSPPPPPDVGWAFVAPSPLLDASVTTCCSHRPAGHVHAREKRRGRERGLSTCSWATRALCRRAQDAGARWETECRRRRPDIRTSRR